MKVDISPNFPPSSSCTAEAPSGSGSDGGGSADLQAVDARDHVRLPGGGLPRVANATALPVRCPPKRRAHTATPPPTATLSRVHGALKQALPRRRRAALIGLVGLAGKPLRRHRSDDPYHAVFADFIAAANAFRTTACSSSARAAADVDPRLDGYRRYVGVDVHPGPNVDVVGDAHRLSQLVDGPFDAVYSISTFEHLAMPWKVVLEINRVLRDGGLLFTATHHTLAAARAAVGLLALLARRLRVALERAHRLRARARRGGPAGPRPADGRRAVDARHAPRPDAARRQRARAQDRAGRPRPALGPRGRRRRERQLPDAGRSP